MITLITMLKRKVGITKEEFREYYENHHAILAKKHVGHLFHDYQRNYVENVTTISAETREFADSTTSSWDCITVLTFKDQRDLDEFYRITSIPEVQRELEEDEMNFMRRGDLHFFRCNPALG